jgi:hypothetical protein
MSDRPTDQAIEAFGRATNTALLAATTKDPVKLALAAEWQWRVASADLACDVTPHVSPATLGSGQG